MYFTLLVEQPFFLTLTSGKNKPLSLLTSKEGKPCTIFSRWMFWCFVFNFAKFCLLGNQANCLCDCFCSCILQSEFEVSLIFLLCLSKNLNNNSASQVKLTLLRKSEWLFFGDKQRIKNCIGKLQISKYAVFKMNMSKRNIQMFAITKKLKGPGMGEHGKNSRHKANFS